MKNCTLHDVAERSGVSKSTVSLVLNGSDKVADETAERVRQAMTALQYRPSRKSTRDGAAIGAIGNIAMLFPDTASGAMGTVLSALLMHGAESTLTPLGCNLIPVHLRPDGTLPACIGERMVDGVLLRSGSEPLSRELQRLGVPLVSMLETEFVIEHADAVTPDNEGIGHLAARFLLDQGRSRLACVDLAPGHVAFKKRGRGFADTAKRAGIAVEWLRATGPQEAVDAILATGADGVFVPGHDAEAVEIHHCLSARGLYIGGALGYVAACTELNWLARLRPAFPLLDINAAEVGRTAADLLIWRLRNPDEPFRRVLIACKPSSADR